VGCFHSFCFFLFTPLFPVRQKAAVAHHLKVLRRDMTDIAPDHLFLRQHLLPVLLRPVVVIVMHHGTAAVVPQLRCRHGWSLQAPTEIFGAPPGSVGFLRKVDLPATSVLRLQIALPLFFYRGYAPAPADCRDLSGYSCDRPAPDFLHGMLFKEDIAPDAMFYIEPATGDGQMNVRMLVELPAVGMQGAEDTDLQALFAGPPEHSAGGGTEEGIKQVPEKATKGGAW